MIVNQLGYLRILVPSGSEPLSCRVYPTNISDNIRQTGPTSMLITGGQNIHIRGKTSTSMPFLEYVGQVQLLKHQNSPVSPVS